MNKTLKVIVAVVMLIATLFALTACGGNKIVATKDSKTFSGSSYKEKLEISFKGDKVNKVVETMEFKNKDEASAYAALLKLGNSSDITVKQKSKKVIITYKGDSSSYSKQSKSELKDALKDAGYKVK